MSQTLDSSRPPLVGKTAFVTGGARGLGAATVRFVLTQPPGTVIPELMVLPMRETSWP